MLVSGINLSALAKNRGGNIRMAEEKRPTENWSVEQKTCAENFQIGDQVRFRGGGVEPAQSKGPFTAPITSSFKTGAKVSACRLAGGGGTKTAA